MEILKSVTRREAHTGWHSFEQALASAAPEYIKQELTANNLNAVRLMAALKPMSDWTIKLPGEIILSQLAIAYHKDRLPMLGISLEKSMEKLQWRQIFKYLFETGMIDLHIKVNGVKEDLRTLLDQYPSDQMQWPRINSAQGLIDYMQCRFQGQNRAIFVDLPEFWHWAIDMTNSSFGQYPQEAINPAILASPIGAILGLALGREIRVRGRTIRQHGLKLTSAFVMASRQIDGNTGMLSAEYLYEMALSLDIDIYKVERALMNSFTMRESERLVLSFNQENIMFDLSLAQTMQNWQEHVSVAWNTQIDV